MVFILLTGPLNHMLFDPATITCTADIAVLTIQNGTNTLLISVMDCPIAEFGIVCLFYQKMLSSAPNETSVCDYH